ncbi:MAG: hypothetical protein ACTHJL_10045 [Amnibacterium sp.]
MTDPLPAASAAAPTLVDAAVEAAPATRQVPATGAGEEVGDGRASDPFLPQRG